MKTQNNLVKEDSTSEIGVYRQQLNEALSLIRILQRSNADLMKQNANVMQMNNRLLKRMQGGIAENPEDHFLARVLSIIGDNNTLQDENSNPGDDNYTPGNENNPLFDDKNIPFADNDRLRNDNGNPFADKSNSRADNNRERNENSQQRNENNDQFGDNAQPFNDNCKEINDNGIIYLEICGHRHDKNKMLESLRYRVNFCQKRNFTDDELLKIGINTFIQIHQQDMEAIKTKSQQKLDNVPALYLLETGNISIEERIYEDAFSDLVVRYRSLKKRAGKNYRSFAKQVKMLLFLYKHEEIKPGHLFGLSGISSVTGNRYVALLKKFNFLKSTGTIDCSYTITDTAIKFLENKNS